MTHGARDDDEVSLVRSVVVKREPVKLEPAPSSLPLAPRPRSPVGHTEQLLLPDGSDAETSLA